MDKLSQLFDQQCAEMQEHILSFLSFEDLLNNPIVWRSEILRQLNNRVLRNYSHAKVFLLGKKYEYIRKYCQLELKRRSTIDRRTVMFSVLKDHIDIWLLIDDEYRWDPALLQQMNIDPKFYQPIEHYERKLRDGDRDPETISKVARFSKNINHFTNEITDVDWLTVDGIRTNQHLSLTAAMQLNSSRTYSDVIVRINYPVDYIKTFENELTSYARLIDSSFNLTEDELISLYQHNFSFESFVLMSSPILTLDGLTKCNLPKLLSIYNELDNSSFLSEDLSMLNLQMEMNEDHRSLLFMIYSPLAMDAIDQGLFSIDDPGIAKHLSVNCYLTGEFVLKYPTANWEWGNLSRYLDNYHLLRLINLLNY